MFGGELTRPGPQELFYIPQRPYLPSGTLRDQIIYPDTKADMKKKGVNDEHIFDLLDIVGLTHIVEREGGWDSD